MAQFKFKYAVMTAGKSRELARIRYVYLNNGLYVITIVPTTDTRSGGSAGSVEARSGEKFFAYQVKPGKMREWFKVLLEGVKKFKGENHKIDCVLIDEVQFFTKEDIHAIKEMACLERDIPVIAFGLRSDFRNEMFEGTAAAFTVAEETEEIETLCAFCRNKAIMNLRFKDGLPVRQGKQIQIGDNEYRPVCHKHYLDDTLNINENNIEEEKSEEDKEKECLERLDRIKTNKEDKDSLAYYMSLDYDMENIDEDVLIEKFKESEVDGYNYLKECLGVKFINGEKLATLTHMKDIAWPNVGDDGMSMEEYKEFRNVVLKEEIELNDEAIKRIDKIR